MGFFIHREREHDRVITMGQPARTTVPEPVIETPPPVVKQTQRRTRKMAKEKEEMNSGSGVETTRQDDASEQGAIGSHGQNAPAQDKQAESGDREDADNG